MTSVKTISILPSDSEPVLNPTLRAPQGGFSGDSAELRESSPATKDVDDTLKGASPSWIRFETSTGPSTEWTHSGTYQISEHRYNLLLRVQTFGLLRRGWSGQRSRAPSKKALIDAAWLIMQLPYVSEDLPNVSPAADGEIGFSWRTSNIKLSVSMFGTGKFSAFGQLGNDRYYWSNESAKGVIRRELSAMIARAYFDRVPSRHEK